MNFKELLMKAKQGDKGAREELFLMYRPMVLSRSRIKGIFSEDLYQELSKTFVSCIEQFSIEGTENRSKIRHEFPFLILQLTDRKEPVTMSL